MKITVKLASGLAALATVALTGASASAATVPAATARAAHTAAIAGFGTTYTVEATGFQAFGAHYHFRYAQLSGVLPNSVNFPYAGEGIAIHLSAGTTDAVLGISTTRGSTGWNAAFAVESESGAISCVNGSSPVMTTGDPFGMSAYFNAHTKSINYTVTDTATSASFTGSCKIAFTPASAFAGVEFGVTPWKPGTGYVQPPANQVLASLTSVQFTSANGSKGGIGGAAFPEQQVLTTSDGTKFGSLIAFPSVTGPASFTANAKGAS